MDIWVWTRFLIREFEKVKFQYFDFHPFWSNEGVVYVINSAKSCLPFLNDKMVHIRAILLLYHQCQENMEECLLSFWINFLFSCPWLGVSRESVKRAKNFTIYLPEIEPGKYTKSLQQISIFSHSVSMNSSFLRLYSL